MASGIKTVGRVGVRVLPNSSEFRRDLQKVLTRVERSVELNVKVIADTTEARKEARDFKNDVEGEEITANVNLDTAVARVRLAALQRPRTVPLNVSVTAKSLAKAATAIAALSGARVVNTYLKRMRNTLENLDRSVPAITGVTLAVSSLASMALSAGGGLITVGAGLAQAATAALALPGILGGAAVGVGVLVVALAGASRYIGDLADGWKALGPVIQDNFWAQAADNVRQLSDSVLPSLRTELAGTADALGRWTASLSDGLREAFTPEVFASMFGNLNQSIDIAAGSTSNFASILAGLGQVGASYLPRLAQWVADLTTQFDAFISGAIASGEIFSWIDAGIESLKQIGSILASVGSILSGINDAAVAAGGGGLATLADVMARIAEVVNGPAFQGALTTIFEGASAGVQGLAAALGPIGDMLVELAPVISSTFSTLGTVLGQVIGSIADALASPAMQAGLTTLVDGIATGLTALMPAMQPLADMLAAVMEVAGPLAGVIGQVLGAALTALAPVVTQLLTAIQPLIPVLGEALVSAITAIAPVLLAVAEAIMPLVSALLPPLTQLITSLVPAIQPLIDAFMVLLDPITQLIGLVAEMIGPLLKPLTEILIFLVKAAVGPTTEAFKALAPIFEFVANIIRNVVVPAVQMITDILNGLITFVKGVFTGNWQQAWDGIVGIFSGIWNGIIGMAKGTLNGLIDVINAMIGGVNDITGKIGIPKIPTIPHLAEGGIVQAGGGGTVALIGEGRHDEAVIPLGGPQFARLAAALAAEGGRGGGDVSLEQKFYVTNLDEAGLARKARREAVAAFSSEGVVV